ncbi:MAG TPA: PilZ domain-containing protein [Polyangiaceae bacterium]|jgi:hypothetical protein
MVDRRRAQRVRVTEPVILVSPRGDFVGEICDVSERGMFVALAHSAEGVGSRLVVRVTPSYPRGGLDLAGVVRWRDDRGLGLELDPSADDAAAIEALIASSRVA